ncbi:hypothetical protein LY474_22000 [Myxococcus stipitatus]|uniref:hypothetical protein n=1 Tax=Myxococcus stipitatus TaxID=83455 RepID=UPI001F2632B8|nr:hypothetical protein [Myxococcus stipitatus]MCE9670480.1 hypothetical protein [Myxococcus stipitatus]
MRLGSGSLWSSASGGLDLINDYAPLDGNRERIDSDLPGSTKPAPYLRALAANRWRCPTRTSGGS